MIIFVLFRRKNKEMKMPKFFSTFFVKSLLNRNMSDWDLVYHSALLKHSQCVTFLIHCYDYVISFHMSGWIWICVTSCHLLFIILDYSGDVLIWYFWQGDSSECICWHFDTSAREDIWTTRSMPNADAEATVYNYN